jgi:hypothetical protein
MARHKGGMFPAGAVATTSAAKIAILYRVAGRDLFGPDQLSQPHSIVGREIRGRIGPRRLTPSDNEQRSLRLRGFIGTRLGAGF